MSVVEDKFHDLPQLHIWQRDTGEPFATSGGFDVRHLRWMSDLLDRHIPNIAQSRVVETGAGLSTLLFLWKGFLSVTSIAPDMLLERNLTRWAAKHGISTEPLHFLTNRAEYELPRLAEKWRPTHNIDLALIDGDHGWPNVFVDFCYLNFLLRTGGVIIFDDCHVYSIAEVVNFLSEDPGWEKIGQYSKMTAFQRKTKVRYTSGGGHPYIARKTAEMNG